MYQLRYQSNLAVILQFCARAATSTWAGLLTVLTQASSPSKLDTDHCFERCPTHNQF
jgi:hypothetical protein